MLKKIITIIFSGAFYCMVYGDVLIDVRSSEEYSAGHIEGALSIEYTDIQNRIGEIIKDKKEKIYLYCRSGRRSGIALQALRALGYENLINLGGLEEARKAWNKLKTGN